MLFGYNIQQKNTEGKILYNNMINIVNVQSQATK